MAPTWGAIAWGHRAGRCVAARPTLARRAKLRHPGMAWLQATSALRIQPDATVVLTCSVAIEAAIGQGELPRALQFASDAHPVRRRDAIGMPVPPRTCARGRACGFFPSALTLGAFLAAGVPLRPNSDPAARFVAPRLARQPVGVVRNMLTSFEPRPPLSGASRPESTVGVVAGLFDLAGRPGKGQEQREEANAHDHGWNWIGAAKTVRQAVAGVEFGGAEPGNRAAPGASKCMNPFFCLRNGGTRLKRSPELRRLHDGGDRTYPP